VIEDVLGGADWRATWQARSRRERQRLLSELRRGEVVHGPEEALLAVREARRLRQHAFARTAGALLGVLVGHQAMLVLLPFVQPMSLGVGAPAGVLLLAVLVWATLLERRRLGRGIAINVAALRHWVEHAQLPGPGPLPPAEAARLLRVIEDEGWTRPHR
jgi:hypothetical protein